MTLLFWAQKFCILVTFIINIHVLCSSMQSNLLLVISNRVISNFYTEMLAPTWVSMENASDTNINCIQGVKCIHQLHVKVCFINVIVSFFSSLIQRYLLEVVYDIFYLPIPTWTNDFPTALQSIGEPTRHYLKCFKLFLKYVIAVTV